MSAPQPPITPPRRTVFLGEPSRTAPALFPRWWYGLLALCTVLFILYGSYVPFQWKQRDWDDASHNFTWALKKRALPESRADWIANVALGVPLGFALLGWLRLDRPGGWTTILCGLAILPVSFAFSTAVEFGQLYCEGRTCAGSDIYAQTVGTVIGIVLWQLCGLRFTNIVRNLLGRDGVRASTLPLLIGYVGVLALAQWLPFDLSASPRDLYHRLRDGTTWVPFTELMPKLNRPQPDELKKIADWILNFTLAVPAGLIASGLPGRFRSINGLMFVAAAGLGGAVLIEAGQLLVQSRHPSTSDVLLGGGGFLLGWISARILADRGVKLYRHEVGVGVVQLWVALLAIMHWQPFEFFPSIVAERLRHLNWLPLAGQAEKNYLWALNEIIEKFIVFLPLGAVVVWSSRNHHLVNRAWLAALVGGLAALILECGQALVVSRSASPTDVLFGLFGGWLGGECTRRVMGVRARVKARPDTKTTKPKLHVVPVVDHVAPAVELPETSSDEPWWAAAEKRFPNVPFPGHGRMPIRVVNPTETPPPNDRPSGN